MQYGFLIGEIAKSKINYVDIANALGITRDTLRYKLNGERPFNIDEAFKIKSNFFPTIPLEQLFSKE